MIRIACVLGGMVMISGCAAHGHHGEAPAPPVRSIPGAGPYTPEELTELHSAIDRIGWLVGRWQGEGFVNGTAPGSTPLPIRTEWEIRRQYDGRFLVLSFTNTRESGRRDHWAGYFTFDVAADAYTTVWVNAGNGYQFQERGALSGDGGMLTLVSKQEGPTGEALTVRSVFRRSGSDGFTVEDTTEGAGVQPVVTFSFSVHRRMDGASL